MATKTYTKGLAERCKDISRYITKYELNSRAVDPTIWGTARQTDAQTIVTACANILGDPNIVFGEQP